MKSISRFVVCAILLCLFSVNVATADSVTLTGGSIVVPGLFARSPVSIVGTRGFSIEGEANAFEGLVAPIAFCGPIFVGCDPGSTIDLRAALSSAALFPVVVTLDGNTYTDVNGFNSPAFAALDLAGSVVLPALEDSALTVTAPFTATGLFSPGFPGMLEFLRGRGTATLRIVPSPDIEGIPPLWVVDMVRYDFADASEPVPEPASLILAGSGVLALLRLRVRRRRSDSSLPQ